MRGRLRNVVALSGIVALALSGKVTLAPFVERRPLASINETFAEIHAHGAPRRVILVPEH